MIPVRRAQPWLGTMVEVSAVAAPEQAHAAIDAALAAVARIHNAMSPQQAGSDVARFNQGAVGRYAIDPWTAEVLQAAHELASASHGAFDITLGNGGWPAWSLLAGQLIKHTGYSRLDLGGIAKGYAVDRAVEALQTAGIAAGWVNAGGDLRVFGDLDFPLHIRSPEAPERSRPLLALRDGAFATSVFNQDAVRQHISVAAPLCLWADALTKVVAFAPAHCEQLLARYHAQTWRHPPL